MKRAITLAVLLLLAVSAAAEDAPDLKKSAVTIPWSDFKAILDKLQGGQATPDPEAPVEFAIGHGSIEGTLADERLELTAKYAVSVFKKGWVICPLVPASSPVAAILLDGKTAPALNHNGDIALALKGPGAHELTMKFRLTAAMRPGPGAVSLTLPAAAGQALTLKVGPKLSGVTVAGATMSGDKAGAVGAILTGNALNLSYTVAVEKGEPAAEKLPTKILAENSTLVSIDEGFVRAVVQLAYEVRHAPVTEFTLQIPAGFDVADCTGPSLVGYKYDEPSRVLTATVGYEVKGAYSLAVVLERSTKEESFSFALPAVQALGVERERGYFAVQVTGGVEVTTGANVAGLQAIDAKELPGGLRGGATNPIVLAFKYLRHPFSADLNVVWHKQQPVLPAAIDTANYVVQVTDDGDCVTRAIYAVRNNRKQFLELKLPGGEKTALWSTFVADKPVKPSKTANGAILLPLEKSSYAGAELNSFTVEVIYYSSLGGSLHPLGGVYLALPEVDLPISRSMLTVFAPGRFDYTRVGGSLRAPYTPAGPTGWFGELAESKNEKDKLTTGSSEKAPAAKPSAPSALSGLIQLRERAPDYDAVKKQAEAEQVFQTRIRAAQQAQDASGALPARFAVPQEGLSLRYEELVTIGEPSTLRLFYLSRTAMAFFAFLSCVLTAALAWFAMSLLSGGADRRRGLKVFGGVAAAIVLLAVLTGSAKSVELGAALGGGALFLRWCVEQILRQQAKARAAK